MTQPHSEIRQPKTRSKLLDRAGLFLSCLCAVHCVSGLVLVAFLGIGGGILLDPAIHEVGMVFALVLGGIGLGRGVRIHGFMLPAAIGSLGLGMMAGSLTLPHGGADILYSVAGVLILALGHDLNRRAVI